MGDTPIAKEVCCALLEAQQALQIAYLTCPSVDASTFETALTKIDGVLERIKSSGETRNG